MLLLLQEERLGCDLGQEHSPRWAGLAPSSYGIPEALPEAAASPVAVMPVGQGGRRGHWGRSPTPPQPRPSRCLPRQVPGPSHAAAAAGVEADTAQASSRGTTGWDQHTGLGLAMLVWWKWVWKKHWSLPVCCRWERARNVSVPSGAIPLALDPVDCLDGESSLTILGSLDEKGGDAGAAFPLGFFPVDEAYVSLIVKGPDSPSGGRRPPAAHTCG